MKKRRNKILEKEKETELKKKVSRQRGAIK